MQPLGNQQAVANAGGEDFRTFIKRTLSASIPEEMVNQMLDEAALENYFRRAFTHRTFATQRFPQKAPKFDYEILETIGDAILKASFQLWLYEVIGEEFKTPQIFSDMEKRLTGTEYLSYLTNNIGFDRWIQVAEGTQITDNIKEDVFEAFIAAIAMAADKFVMTDIGFGFAKRWIYQVYNTYTRETLNPRDPKSYVDYRSQVNDIWQFHGWGTPYYQGLTSGTAAKSVGAQSQISVNLMGSNKTTFPEFLRGRVLGAGSGATIDEAREKASEDALNFIGANYPELKFFEIQMASNDPGKFKEVLAADPALLQRVTKAMNTYQNQYQALAIRKLRTYGVYAVQLRLQIDGIWKSAVRTKSTVSFDDAVIRAFKVFADSAENGKLRV